MVEEFLETLLFPATIFAVCAKIFCRYYAITKKNPTMKNKTASTGENAVVLGLNYYACYKKKIQVRINQKVTLL